MTNPPPELPKSLRAWARGRSDRVISRRPDGSVTLVLFTPGETVTASFPNAVDAALALEAHSVNWQTATNPTAGGNLPGRGLGFAPEDLTSPPIVRTFLSVAPEPKDERWHMRLSSEDRAMLAALAEKAGESEAVVVRRLIREAYAKGPGRSK